MSFSWAEGHIDGHCHLADPRFSKDLEKVLEASRLLGIKAWIQGGVEPSEWASQLELKARFGESVGLVFGLHPWWVASHSKAEFDEALRHLEAGLEPGAHPDYSGCLALGEMGLDWGARCSKESQPVQIHAFERSLALSKKVKKPVVLHIVRAHDDAWSILKKPGVFEGMRGIVHSFSGDWRAARRYLDLGLSLSFGGGLCRAEASSIQEVFKKVPENAMVLETDCPDQAPEGWQSAFKDAGRRNDPTSLLWIAEFGAELRGQTSAVRLLETSSRNLKRIFGSAG
jgi:TatD DNase family protein